MPVGRLLITLVTLMVMAGCSSQSGTTASLPSNAVSCPQERPQMCTMDYTPVCSIRTDGSRKTYGNGCTACSDLEVEAYTPGACEDSDLSSNYSY